MAASASAVKELREISGAGMMDCKRALDEAGNDIKKAMEVLRKSGVAKAQKKAGRSASDGMVLPYIHPGSKLGVLIEVNCETDFVAKTEDFQNMVKDIAMHIAASGPIAVNKEDVPVDILETEKEIYADQARKSGKPENIIDKSSVKTSTKVNIVVISNIVITFFGFISLIFVKKYFGFQVLGMIAFATSFSGEIIASIGKFSLLYKLDHSPLR